MQTKRLRARKRPPICRPRKHNIRFLDLQVEKTRRRRRLFCEKASTTFRGTLKLCGHHRGYATRRPQACEGETLESLTFTSAPLKILNLEIEQLLDQTEWFLDDVDWIQEVRRLW